MHRSQVLIHQTRLAFLSALNAFVTGLPYLLQQEVDTWVAAVRWGRTLAEALGACRIGHLVEHSCYRRREDFGMMDRILLAAGCLGATIHC